MAVCVRLLAGYLPVITRYRIKHGMKRPEGTAVSLNHRVGDFSPIDTLDLYYFRQADKPGVRKGRSSRRCIRDSAQVKKHA